MSTETSEKKEVTYADASGFEAQASEMTKGAACTSTCTFGGDAKRKLRGLGHSLKPVVMIGQNGLTDGLGRAIEMQLDLHELIKIKIQDGAPCSLQHAAIWIHAATGAAVPQILGNMLLAYRAHPERPTIYLPE